MSRWSKPWRVIATAASFALFGVGALILSLGLVIFLKLLPIQPASKHRYTRCMIMHAARKFIGFMQTTGVLTFEFDEIEKLNQPGVLVIANHPTLLDAVLLMSVMPNANFIVKAAMANNFFTSTLVAMADYIPNSEIAIALVKKAARALNKGETLMIFPEGTRTTASGLHFKRSAAIIALQAKCPIQPVLISCEPITLRKHEKWYSIPASPPVFRLHVLPLLHINECIDTSQPLGAQARELNLYLQHYFSHSLSNKGVAL